MPAGVKERTATGLVCHCRKVPYERVESAIEDGARSLADVQRATTACTHCFGCRFELEGMLQARLGDEYERSATALRPEETGPAGIRGRLARLLGRETSMPPKRMYMPVLEGFAGSAVRTRVALFHWPGDEPGPVGYRADLMTLDGERVAVHEGSVKRGATEVLEVGELLAESGGELPGGAGTMKVVLDAEKVMSLRPYFHWITPSGITSTHEKGAPRLGRITKARGYHWVFPSGYAERPAHAYFFLTNALTDPLRGAALAWKGTDGSEAEVAVPELEIDQSACVPLHEHMPALAAGRVPGTVRLTPALHVAGFIVRHDREADLWRVQHL